MFGELCIGFVTVFVFLFATLYLNGAFRQEPKYRLENVPSLDDPRFSRMVTGLSNGIPTSGEITGFWVEADAIYAARNAAIRQAQQLILFETYFMAPGDRADEFAQALIERAQAGVRIKMILDAYRTRDIPDRYWRRLRNAGIELRFFREFDWRAPLEYNSRTHRKLLIIDGQRALIGGAGVSDYWDGDPKFGDTAPWLDFEVAYEGQIVDLLEGQFLQNWIYTGSNLNLEVTEIAANDAKGEQMYIHKDTSTLSESDMRMLFKLSFLAARDRVWIASPYFVPDTSTRQAIIQAQQNGADVRVLTVSEKSDKPFVRYAARQLYGELLAAGVQVCEYQPSMMHAKVMLIDKSWASTGSANFDPRSYFHNDELNVSTRSPQLVENLESFFAQAWENSHCLTLEEWRDRPLTERIQGRLALLFKPLL
ncbi:MAG: phosphatidylserine/phosphatidylglycerophosphate/cardiolipin synthase family protein [Desertifilum sp. SIO1I2]|nr:phosphatidylserine/phosphatidylglycerophosphate/cardiolipin synthase family protein [Desertifilum sp. SIO1I2]